MLPLDGSLERLETDCEFPAEEIHIRLRQRPVDLYRLPLAVLEMEDVCGAGIRLLVVPADLLLDARPPDGPFFPRLDLCAYGRERVQLFELPSPDRSYVGAVEPFLWVGSDHQGAWVLRHASQARLGIAFGYRSHPSLDDAADLIRRFHAAKSRAQHPAVQQGLVQLRIEARPDARSGLRPHTDAALQRGCDDELRGTRRWS